MTYGMPNVLPYKHIVPVYHSAETIRPKWPFTRLEQVSFQLRIPLRPLVGRSTNFL